MKWVGEMLTIHEGEPSGFPNNASKYRCCCRYCHVKFGTATVASFEAICITIQLINTLYFLSITDDIWRGIADLLAIVLTIVFIALLCEGCRKETAWLLLPHLVFQVVSILFTVGLLASVLLETDQRVYSLFNVSYNEQASFEVTRKIDSIKGVVIFGLTVALIYELIALYIVFKCYRYFHDKLFFIAVDNEETVINRVPL